MVDYNRRNFLKTVGLGTAAFALSSCKESFSYTAKGNQTRRPNVIFIYADDQDLADLTCYGGNQLMPNTDKLVAESMRFDRFYISSAICTASRFSTLTGRFASRGKAIQKAWPTDKQINIGYEGGVYNEDDTIAHIMKGNGYKTGMVGKWMQGFSEEIKMMDGALDARDPQVDKKVKESYRKLQESIISTGFDYVESAFYGNTWNWWSDKPYWVPKELRHHNQDWITKGAIDFIEENKDEPFFLYMPTTLVHTPQAFESIKVDPRTTQAGYLDEAPDVQKSRESIFERLKDRGYDFDNVTPEQLMDAHIASGTLWLDDGLGVVLDKLDQLGLADDTVVIYSSDNGRKAKFSTYDSGARVPLLVRWPGKIKPNSVCEQLTSNVDIAPTIYDICEITPPADAAIDGKSLLPALLGKNYNRDSIFMEITIERAVVSDDNFKYIAVRYPEDIRKKIEQGRLYNRWCEPMPESKHSYDAEKYFPAYFDADQLYDLNNDPGEQINLAGDAEYAKKLKQMKKLMKDYSQTLPHPFAEFKK